MKPRVQYREKYAGGDEKKEIQPKLTKYIPKLTKRIPEPKQEEQHPIKHDQQQAMPTSVVNVKVKFLRQNGYQSL